MENHTNREEFLNTWTKQINKFYELLLITQDYRTQHNINNAIISMRSGLNSVASELYPDTRWNEDGIEQARRDVGR